MNNLLWALIAACIFSTAAAAAPCGSYIDKQSGASLRFYSDGTAKEFNKQGVLQASYYHYKSGSVITLKNSENGLGEIYKIGSNGLVLNQIESKWGDKRLDAVKRYSCRASASLKYLTLPECEYGKEESCCKAGDMFACVKSAAAREDLQTLQQQFATRPDACLALMELHQKKANASSGLFNFYAEKKPIPDGPLHELTQACDKHRTPDLCRKTAEQLWTARKFVQARSVMKMVCDGKLMEKGCEIYGELNSIDLPDKLPEARLLPCGSFKSNVSGLMSELEFADRGIVGFGLGSSQRARLEDGLIKVRHDKGGDFIYARLSEDLLLGLDSWNQFAIYKKQDGTVKQCLPPVVYKEVPLSDHCGLSKDPAQCCAEGDTQGCNRLGNMAALRNNWKEAAQQYGKVCGKGVRIGCENWIYTVGKTGDDKGVETGLKQLCSQDERHVACDLLEQNRIDKAMMLFEMEKLLKEAGASK